MDTPANGSLAASVTARAVTPLKDRLLRLSPAECQAGNVLARFRAPFVLKGQFGDLSIRLCHPRAIQTVGIDFVRVDCRANGTAFSIHVPATGFATVAGLAKGDVSLAAITDEGRALLVEHVLDDALSALERRGIELRLETVSEPVRNPWGQMGAECRIGTLPPFGVLIDAPPALLRSLMLAAERLPPPPRGFGAVPVELRVLAGVTRMPALDLHRLAVGSAILFDHSWLPQHRLAIVAGSTVLWAGQTSARGVVLVSKAPVTEMRERFQWLDDSNAAGAYMDDQNAAIDPLEVKLVFEMGRLTMSVADLAKLDAGHVFELSRLPEQAVDIFVMNRQIGSGELVMVGDRIGVRITRTTR